MFRRVLAALLAGPLLIAPAALPAQAAVPPVGTAEGIVLDHGRPVAGVRVCPPFADGCNIPITTTGADGRFRLEGLHAGTSQLLFVTPGGGLKELYPGPDDAPFAVPEDGVATIVKRGFGPHGAIEGRILTNSGAPAGGAILQLPIYRHYMTTTADADGYYKLDFLPEVTSRISIRRNAVQSPTQWVPRKKVEAEGVEVTTRIGTTLRINERLLPMGTIAGTFTGPGGAGAPAGVTADGSGTAGADDGSYSMLVWAGDQRLYFDPVNSDQNQWATAAIAKSEATVFHVGEDQVVHHDEKAIAQGGLRGRLFDHTGAPAEWGVEVLNRDGVQLAYTFTDSDGN